MENVTNQNLESKRTEQEEKKLIIAELTEQIKRMTDYVEQHSQSNTVALHNTLRATMRYRDSLVASLTRLNS